MLTELRIIYWCNCLAEIVFKETNGAEFGNTFLKILPETLYNTVEKELFNVKCYSKSFFSRKVIYTVCPFLF